MLGQGGGGCATHLENNFKAKKLTYRAISQHVLSKQLQHAQQRNIDL